MVLSALLTVIAFSPPLMATHAADPALEARAIEIFESSCTACHDSDDPSDAEGIDLADHLPLGEPADRRIAGHLPDAGGVHRHQSDPPVFTKHGSGRR